MTVIKNLIILKKKRSNTYFNNTFSTPTYSFKYIGILDQIYMLLLKFNS